MKERITAWRGFAIQHEGACVHRDDDSIVVFRDRASAFVYIERRKNREGLVPVEVVIVETTDLERMEALGYGVRLEDRR